MKTTTVDLRQLFEELGPGVVAVTGGGGKTGLLFSLAESLSKAGHPVLSTTTTRMARPHACDWLTVALTDNPGGLAPTPVSLFVARPPGPDGDPEKVYGYSPEDVDEMARHNPGAWILVEADGSAGRPLKAPAAHEPVVPTATAVAVAVVGLSGFGKPAAKDTVFRMDEFTAITGLIPGETVTPKAVAALVNHPEGLFKNAPASARRFIFCNQADVPGGKEAAAELARAIRRGAPGFLDGFLVGSLRTKGLECQSYPVK